MILEASRHRQQQGLLAFRGEIRPSGSCISTLPGVSLGCREGRWNLRGMQGSSRYEESCLNLGFQGGSLWCLHSPHLSVCLDNSEALQVAVWIFCCSLHFMQSSCTSWNLQCGNILTRNPCNIVTSSIIWTKSQFPPCDLNIKDGHSLLNFFSLRGRKWGWFFCQSVFKCSQR